MKYTKIFLYGTLKVGGVLTSTFIDENRECYERASVKGYDLYDAGYFPAMVDGNGVVKGELHYYKNGEDILKILDAIEGYDKQDHARSLYIRKKIEVLTDNGRQMAYAYIFNRKPVGKKIEKGEWYVNK